MSCQLQFLLAILMIACKCDDINSGCYCRDFKCQLEDQNGDEILYQKNQNYTAFMICVNAVDAYEQDGDGVFLGCKYCLRCLQNVCECKSWRYCNVVVPIIATMFSIVFGGGLIIFFITYFFPENLKKCLAKLIDVFSFENPRVNSSKSMNSRDKFIDEFNSNDIAVVAPRTGKKRS
mmetsp:Transcript_72794/g.89280  ORF Transcript_72794/g.89280 Transcript_72794/m.89280 type:complete len:177 (-) Transcript_72794:84-614(-)